MPVLLLTVLQTLQKKRLREKPTNPNEIKNNHEAAVKVFAHSVSCNTVRIGLITVF